LSDKMLQLPIVTYFRHEWS